MRILFYAKIALDIVYTGHTVMFVSLNSDDDFIDGADVPSRSSNAISLFMYMRRWYKMKNFLIITIRP